MALLPLKPCSTVGCRALVRGQARCDAHTVDVVAERREDRKAYTRDWRKLSRLILDERPMCEVCRRAYSRLVHHVIEVRDDPDLLLEPSNLRALCDACHRTIHAGAT